MTVPAFDAGREAASGAASVIGPRAHGWGKMYCPHNDPDCRCGEFCVTVIWGTPKSPENHALQIRRVVDGCLRRAAETDDEHED